MILKASQRGGGRKLAFHLMNDRDNEHVEVHQIRGFMSGTVVGAFAEAEAVSLGTKCKQYLFSLSLSPPKSENVRIEVFESAIERIEKSLGLTGQPRAIVFHEKEGRRHCHAVWSRIDVGQMKAKQMSLFGRKLAAISRELYIENGWNLPKGHKEGHKGDKLNYSLAEKQQAKQFGTDPKVLRDKVQNCYESATDAKKFSEALKAKGIVLAQGDNKAFVIVTPDGQVTAVSRLVGVRKKDVRAKLGDSADYPTVAAAKDQAAALVSDRVKEDAKEARQIAANQMKPLHAARLEMKTRHAEERRQLAEKQKERRDAELRECAARLPHGLKALWFRFTGQYAKIRAQNELEASFALQRDRLQKNELIHAQLIERGELQQRIDAVRERHQNQLAELSKELGIGVRSEGMTQGHQPRAGERSRGLELGLG